MKFKKFVLFLFCITNTVFGQQTYQFSQYYFNKFLYNPAFAGYEDYVDIKSGYRNQWNGSGATNQSFYLTGNAALGKKDNTSDGPTPFISALKPYSYQKSTKRKNDFKPSSHQGVGLQLANDVWGPLQTISIAGSYAFHIPLGGERKVSAGFTIGQYYRIIDLSPGKFDVSNPTDPLLQAAGKLTTNQNLINIGVSYYNREAYIGLSAIQPIMETFNYTASNQNGNNNSQEPTVTTNSFGSMPSVFVLQGGLKKEINNDVTFYPTFLIKYLNINRMTAETTMRFMVKESIWGGVSYRFRESIGLHAGVRLSSSLLVNYTYEFQNYVGPFGKSLSSNEISLAYMFYWRGLKLK